MDDEPKPGAPDVLDDTDLRGTLRKAVGRPHLSAAGSFVRGLMARAGLFKQIVRIDRYELIRVIGEGGMGVVVLARDPNFATEVAIKVLDGTFDEEAGAAASEAQRAAWLKLVHHEAMQLMAVRGPHVVGVFNAGLVEGFRWLAMEYVEGEDLESWVEGAKAPVSWRTIVARFVDAARGLQSVHAAGLVHRDFKPRNAVLDRRRDRVCVIDFGLVTGEAGPEEMTQDGTRPAAEGAQTARSGTPPLRSSLYRAPGTPMYMSPEQAAGARLDARSDQFSFCLALYWALYGRVPFEGETTASHVRRLGQGGRRVRLPRHRPRHAEAVPRWLHALLERGMALESEDRHASMAAIVAELTRDRTRPYRVGGALTAVFSAALVAGIGLVPWAQSRSCQARGAEVSSAEFDARRAELEAKFGVGGAVMATLDGFAGRWRGRWDASCDDHFRRGVPGLAARQQCLQQQSREAASLIEALLAAEIQPERGPAAVRSLGDPAVCDAAGLNRAKPASEGQREAIAAVDEELATARAAQWVGDYEAAQANAEQAAGHASSIEHAPTLARARLVAGEVARIRGNFAESQASLEAAHRAAIAGRDVFTAIASRHELARVGILARHDRAAGAAALVLAEAHLADVGWDAPPDCVPEVDRACVQHIRMWAEHQDLRGLLAHLRLGFADAWTLHDAAVSAWRRLGASEDVRVELSRSLLNRGRSEAAMARREEARADFAEARALRGAVFGANPSELAVELFNTADLARIEGQYELAIAEAEAAGEFFRDAEGEVSAQVARAEALLGLIAFDRSDMVEARRRVDRALEIQAAAPEVTPADRTTTMQLSALVAREQGDPGRERQEFAALVEFLRGVEGKRCEEALARVELSVALRGVGREAAAEELRRAEVMAAPLTGCEARAEVERALGEVARADGDLEGALRHFERAAAESLLSRAVLAELQWAQAELLGELGRERERARGLARSAREVYAAQGEGGKATVEVIDRWLAGHI